MPPEHEGYDWIKDLRDGQRRLWEAKADKVDVDRLEEKVDKTNTRLGALILTILVASIGVIGNLVVELSQR